MLAKPQTCAGCQLEQLGRGFSRPEGHGTNRVLIVGEALGANEAIDGLPFRPYASAGSMLERCLKVSGLSRSQFRLTNCIHCAPPKDWLVDAPWEFASLQHCRQYLDAEIDEMRPKVILALGGVALRELTGMSGWKQGITYLRGFPLTTPDGAYTVVSSFHPQFIRHGNSALTGVLIHDIQLAVAIARQGVPERLPLRYQPHPSLDDALRFALRCEASPNLWLTYDIETPTSASEDEDEREEDASNVIKQIQFSLAPGEGIVFPGDDPGFMSIARRIISGPHRKAGHFVHTFDDAKMRANGFKFGGPPTTDTFEIWHHLQPDLISNLQFIASFCGFEFPWKHFAGTDDGLYGCCDVDAPQRILAKLPDTLQQRELWDSYIRNVYELRPILDEMSMRGIPVTKTKLVAFGDDLDAELQVVFNDMQALVPVELLNVHPKEGYKKTPKDTTGMVEREFNADIPEMNLDLTFSTMNELQLNNVQIDDITPLKVKRWCKLEPFTPSPKQLIKYMHHKGHQVPKHRKTDKDTTEATELTRLYRKTNDKLYKLVIDYRELQKMYGTYVKGWMPGDDNRVHTTYTFRPATAQLSSKSPNVQNYPVHEKEGRDTGLADKFLRCLEAPDGYRWVTFDHKSFHALTLAHLAKDPDYERIVRLDIHSFVASEYLKLKSGSQMFAMPDDGLRDYLKWVKQHHAQVRDGKAKRTILKWGFGGGYRTTYQMYRESFANEADAKRMQDTLEALFPRTVKYRLAIRHQAAHATFLVSPFKFIRWFWDVIDWSARGGTTRRCSHCGLHHGWGEQSEQAIAFLPANCAFGMMRSEMREFKQLYFDSAYGYVNTVHDSHMFLCPDALVEACMHNVKLVMEGRDATIGLWCATTVSVGRNLAKKSDGNPNGKEEIDVSIDRGTSIANQVGADHVSGHEGRSA